MREVTVKIPENKYDAFVAMMKELKIEVPEHGVEDEISIEQQQEVERRLKLMEEGKMGKRSWSDAKQAIFKR